MGRTVGRHGMGRGDMRAALGGKTVGAKRAGPKPRQGSRKIEACDAFIPPYLAKY